MPRFQIHTQSFLSVVVFLFPLFVDSGRVFAQAANVNTALDTTKVAQTIEPVSVTNIGTETELTLASIREIRNKIKPTKSEIELDSLIPRKMKVVENY